MRILILLCSTWFNSLNFEVDLNIINLRIEWVNGFGGAQEKQPSSLQKEVLANCEFQLIYVLKVQKW